MLSRALLASFSVFLQLTKDAISCLPSKDTALAQADVDRLQPVVDLDKAHCVASQLPQCAPERSMLVAAPNAYVSAVAVRRWQHGFDERRLCFD